MRYLTEYLAEQESQSTLQWLQNSVDVSWHTEHFKLFGREHVAPRTLTWFGDEGINYRYTGIDHEAQGWPRKLIVIRDRIRNELGIQTNFVLINRYANGAQYMGWHRDDERATEQKIASISLGGTRRFRYRYNDHKLPSRKTATQIAQRRTSQFIDLEHGSMLVFDGRCAHMLSKTKKQVSTRFNLTFRVLNV